MVDFVNPFGSLLEGYVLGENQYIKAERAKRERRAMDLDHYLKSTERGFVMDQATTAFERDLQRMGVAQGYQQDNLNLEYGLRDQNADASHVRTLERDDVLDRQRQAGYLTQGIIDGKVGGAAGANWMGEQFGSDFGTFYGGATDGSGAVTVPGTNVPLRPADAPTLSFGSAVGSPNAPGLPYTPAVEAAPAAPQADLRFSQEQGDRVLEHMDAQNIPYRIDPATGVVWGQDGQGGMTRPLFQYGLSTDQQPAFDPYEGQTTGPLTMTMHPDGAYQTYTSDVGNQVLAQLDAQGVPYQLDMRTGIVWGANNQPLFGIRD